MCLNLKLKGYRVGILPVSSLNHRSSMDSMSKEYYKSLIRVCRKYKNDYDVINTVFLSTNTKFPIKVYISMYLEILNLKDFAYGFAYKFILFLDKFKL